jgi:hypothetical protein
MPIDRSHAITRLNELLTGHGRDRIYAIMPQPNPVEAEFTAMHEAGEVPFPDSRQRAQFWAKVCAAQPFGLLDDSVPNCYLWEFDQGLIGGVLGAEVSMLCEPASGHITSMTKPFAHSLQEASQVRFDESSIWWKRYINQMDIYAQAAAQGGFGISHLTVLSGLHFLMELRGATNAYLDLLDEPLLAREVIAYSVEVNHIIQDAFFEHVPLYAGGTASYAIQWMPGRVIAESVDSYHMTKVDWFEEHGRWVLEQTVQPYDGMMLHLHSNGLHLLKSVSTLPKLQCITLGDDTTAPFRIYERLDELDKLRGDVPIAASIPCAVFEKRLRSGTLTPNMLYYVQGVNGVDAANQMMDLVRAYRA